MAIASHQPPLDLRNHDNDDEERYPSSDGKPMAETPKHRETMQYCISAITAHLRERRPDAYVSGNDFVYYEEHNPKARVSPDCYVVFGVPGLSAIKPNSFLAWKHGNRLPAVVLEITSKKTRREDVSIKLPLYEQTLRVPEYFQFDPTGDYLTPRLQGYRLTGEQQRYAALEMTDNRLHSQQLGLDLIIEGETLRLLDPTTGTPLWTSQELTERASREADRAAFEARRAEAETARANEAEAEVARLRAELNALRREQR